MKDTLRPIDAIPPDEDTDITACPYLDTDNLTSPNYRNGRVFLGRTSKITDWQEGTAPGSIKNLTVQGTANPFFADFSPLNGGVFSFHDDMSVNIDGIPGPIQLQDYSVDYVVTGYYSDPDSDPIRLPKQTSQTPAARLAACSMQTNPGSLSDQDKGWLSPDPTNGLNTDGKNMSSLCHGNFLNLRWSPGYVDHGFPNAPTTPAMVELGDIVQRAFALSHPLAIGTNPIDALFGWLRSSPDTDPSSIKQSLLKLQSLVLDVNDDIDSQIQSEDLLATNNFIPSPHGVLSQYADTITPTQTEIDALRNLNALESKLNALNRRSSRLKAQLFGQWWIYVADRGKGDNNARITLMTKVVSDLKGQLTDTQNAITPCQGDIVAAKGTLLGLQDGAEHPFYTQRDPTMFVAGLANQWAADYDQDLTVRLDDQVANHPSTPQYIATDADPFGGKLPANLVRPISDLVNETYFENAAPSLPDPSLPVPGQYSHNGDRWQTQNGWFPLYIEWEVEYYHIPYESWEFGPQGPESRFGYKVCDGVDITATEIQDDFRIMSGRCPVLPQAANALAVVLKQVFSKVSPDILDSALGEDQRNDLLAGVGSLDFVSTQMSGFTDQLLTQATAAHMMPVTYDSSGNATVLPATLSIAQEIGFTSDDLMIASSEAVATPFASLVPIPADPATISPFKPCIHGQFRFTKFNIVDKFGQVVEGVKTAGDTRLGTSMSTGPLQTTLYPCLGDSYSVSTLPGNSDAKTVLPSPAGLCPFVQLPPSINQPARINGEFMVRSGNSWKRAPQYHDPTSPSSLDDNPVKGWLVIDSANSSLQFFSPNGSFIVEISIASASPTNRPFAQDTAQSVDPLVQGLIDMFAFPGYLTGFFGSLTKTVESVQANPTSYGESMLSMLGRPLALTVFGVSLELQDPPMVNQSTIAPTQTISQRSLLEYDFGLKVGDKDNVFDGLYGYFNIQPSTASPHYSSFYTYHPLSKDEGDTLLPADPSKSIPSATLRPFYADPTDLTTTIPEQQDSQLRLFAALIDPFTPVNIYTALLPIKQLTLPSWSITAGISNIVSFFKTGPILIPTDVPPFDPTAIVTKDYTLADDSLLKPTTASIPIPSVGLGDWAWLQPYYANAENGGKKTQYNALGVSPGVTNGIGWVGGPYTAVEGYLQMRKPFTKPDPSGVSGDVGPLQV